jgi:anti-sigma-K factor RskA
MSEGPELTDVEALAAEHALGVLGGREREEADARMARDAAFAADVEAWRSRLAPLYDGLEPIAPSDRVWLGIERQLPANDNGEASEKRLRFWRGATGGSISLLAASLVAVVMLASQPPQVVEVRPASPQGQLLNASLTATTGRAQPLFIAAYDPDRKALIVTSLLPEGSDPAKVHELWMIAGKENPKPLGFIEPGKAKMIPMPVGMDGKMAEGVAIAVSVEPPGGSPKPDGPSGPVIGVGKLTRL